MKRSRLNPIGKTGRKNLEALRIQQEAFGEAGITWCELCRYVYRIHRFMVTPPLHFAHYRKRSKGLSDDELIYGVALLHDEPCHGGLDRGPADIMASTILNIIISRDVSGGYFSEARALALARLAETME